MEIYLKKIILPEKETWTYPEVLAIQLQKDLEIIAANNYLLEAATADVVGIQNGDNYEIYNFTNVEEFFRFKKKHTFPVKCDAILMKLRDCIKNVELGKYNNSFEEVLRHCQRNNDHLIW